ncbi:MAG: hypothetical protein GY715_19400 [Planctomycetes bacterium]|nr:hypothetical protein [Planctomycetota bacterium]
MIAIFALNAFGVAPIRYTPVTAIGLIVVSVAVQLFAVVCVLQLQAVLRVGVGTRILTGVLMFAPCVNLLVLLSVNARATHVLKRAGLEVGLLGVSPGQLERVFTADLCSACGYRLDGNLSGTCPECGEPSAR